MNIKIQFNAWLPELEIMLENVTIYDSGLLGIDSDDLEEAIKKKNKHWKIYDDGIYFSDDDHFDRLMTLLCGDDWYWIESGDFIPLQLTGMTDGDKNDLFEDDLLKIERDGDADIGPIVYDKEHGHFMFKSSDGSFYGITSGDKYNHKIGNLYQNFNLLKQ